jgi:large subunit ribosomal protein L18
MTKKEARVRRAKKTRYRIREQQIARLTVHRSAQHIYAQLVIENNLQSLVLASASSLEKDLRAEAGTKTEKAKRVGTMIAERAKTAGIQKVAFDRSGFRYHGRIKALAMAARESGLDF